MRAGPGKAFPSQPFGAGVDALDALDAIDFEKMDGLVPCITQHALTGRVLMLAYMNREALEATLEQGQVHYWSRSREELWRKGATSGNTQALVALGVDCDRDALLALVDPEGPACHTGEVSCFYTSLEGTPLPVLVDLWRVIDERATHLPEGSWTARLVTEEGLVEEKVLEEARELVGQARLEDPDAGDGLAHELADLVYHALVLARKHGASLEDLLRELRDRRG